MIDRLVEAYEKHLDETFDHDPKDLEDYKKYIQRGVTLLNAANKIGYNLHYVPRSFNQDLSERPGYVKVSRR